MRRILIGILVLLSISYFMISYVNAQDSSCGIPGASDGGDQCCCVDPSKHEVLIAYEDVLDEGGMKAIILSKIRKLLSNLFGNDSYDEGVLQAMACSEGEPSDVNNICNTSCKCIVTEKNPGKSKLCIDYLANKREFNSCVKCFEEDKGFWTGIGCIYMEDWKSFIGTNIFGTLISLAGILSFGCIIFSAFNLTISQGNPEKIKSAQKMLTSCISGLLVIIFAAFILRLIGVDILRIYGFG